MHVDIEKIHLGELKIEYAVCGSGPDLLLLHGGGGGSYQTYFPFMKSLSKYFRVWAPSMPGGGGSSSIPSGWKFSDFGVLIKEFVNTLNLTPYIVGHSFGGAITIKAKSDFPKMFRTPVLLAPAGAPREGVDDIMSVTAVLQNELPVLFYLKSGTERRDIILDVVRHKKDLIKITKMFLALDLRKEIKQLPTDTLLLFGRNDRVLPPKYMKELKDVIPGKRARSLKGTHYFFNEAPQQVSSMIKKHLLDS